MKKHILIAALALSLLSVTALAACHEDPSVDTESASVTESVSESETDESSETESESGSDTDTETESASESESESDTEEESVTAAPRYDYFEAEVAPDVTIDPSAYTDMKLTLPAYLQVTDADVADYIEYIRFDYRSPDNGDTQMTDKPLKFGDDAFIYYKGVIDGEEFDGGSNWDEASPYQLGLGSGAFIPGFEEGLVGVIPANATKSSPVAIQVTFPENYSSDVAGKEATFYVAVAYAVQYSLPEYNRAFVEDTLQYEGEKNFYASDKAYLSEFENYIRAYLEEELATDVENAKIDALWTALTEKAECRNLPTLEIAFYYDNYAAEIAYYYDYYTSYGGENFIEEYPTEDDFACVYVGLEKGGDWKAELDKYARRMVGKDMLAHAIAEREGIEFVTDEEYQAEIDYWVDAYYGYMTEDDIVASMGEIALRESAFAVKIQNWLLERATFTFETSAE